MTYQINGNTVTVKDEKNSVIKLTYKSENRTLYLKEPLKEMGIDAIVTIFMMKR